MLVVIVIYLLKLNYFHAEYWHFNVMLQNDENDEKFPMFAQSSLYLCSKLFETFRKNEKHRLHVEPFSWKFYVVVGNFIWNKNWFNTKCSKLNFFIILWDFLELLAVTNFIFTCFFLSSKLVRFLKNLKQRQINF